MKICYPNAKINLGLQILSRRSDGYHNLQTVFFPIPLCDTLELRPLDFYDTPWELHTAGIPTDCRPEQNLVVRVWTALQQEFSLPPHSIYLHKRIPSGAGLGGGSADAAFMMRLCNHHFHLGLTNVQMQERLAAFGADCPFFVVNRSCYATDTGTTLEPVNLDLSPYWLLLVKPKLSISTAQAYAGVTPRPAAIDLRQALMQNPAQWPSTVHNDFEDSVFPQYPALRAIRDTLCQMRALYAAMSGSGSAIYAIMPRPWPNPEDVFPDCFVFQHRLRLYKETWE